MRHLVGVALWVLSLAWAAATANARSPGLQVSADGRGLVDAKGKPVFLLIDTAWELLHRLDRREAAEYLDARKAQGFGAIMMVALPELSLAKEANAYGDFPLRDLDPRRPAITPGAAPNDPAAYDYWDHVDYVVGTANARGLTVGLVASWGRWVNDAKDRIFDAERANHYGRFIGKRYRGRDVFWVLGGDRHPKGFEEVWRAMADGITRGVTGKQEGPLTADDHGAVLMTFHPGARTSSPFFHDDAWLDFNATYTGHAEPEVNRPWRVIAEDWARTPTKPVLDLEPIYEDIPFGIATFDRGYSSERDVRRSAYWSVFSGACGAVYGNHATWQMWQPKHKRIYGPLMSWRAALGRPGATQLVHLRRLIESRPREGRVPDPMLLPSPPKEARAHQVAMRGDGFAFVYGPLGGTIEVALDRLEAKQLRAWWFDPRTGAAEEGERLENQGGTRSFVAPTGGDGGDWVLVLDDAGRGFAAPGSRLVQGRSETSSTQTSKGPSPISNSTP